jgi:hypothetical protein
MEPTQFEILSFCAILAGFCLIAGWCERYYHDHKKD